MLGKVWPAAFSFTYGIPVPFPSSMSGWESFSVSTEGVPGGAGEFRREGAGEAAADDVGGVHDEEEGVRVYVLDEMAQFGDLRQIHDSENDFLSFPLNPPCP